MTPVWGPPSYVKVRSWHLLYEHDTHRTLCGLSTAAHPAAGQHQANGWSFVLPLDEPSCETCLRLDQRRRDTGRPRGRPRKPFGIGVIRDVLWSYAHDDTPLEIQRVSAELGVSERSVRRRVTEGGSSWDAEKRRARAGAAR